MTRRPDFFIVGAPKCGTTSLYDYLRGHPEVYLSPVKEPGYFSPDIRPNSRVKFDYGVNEEAYLALFADARNEKRVGEATVYYLASRMAPRLVAEFQPAARIIVMLRNPVDMMHALHNERVRGTEDIHDFEEAITADRERLRGRRLRRGATTGWSVYRNFARYGEQLGRWSEVFPRDRIHVVLFDDFAADTPAEFRKVLEFLEVNPSYQPRSFAARRASWRRRGGPLRPLLSNPVSRTVSRRVLPLVLGRNRAFDVVRRFRQSRLNRRAFSRPPIRPELRRQLEDELMADVARLSDVLERDLVQLWFGRPRPPVEADEDRVRVAA